MWLFWRFGFLWMLGLRLAYYAMWHLACGSLDSSCCFERTCPVAMQSTDQQQVMRTISIDS